MRWAAGLLFIHYSLYIFSLSPNSAYLTMENIIHHLLIFEASNYFVSRNSIRICVCGRANAMDPSDFLMHAIHGSSPHTPYN
jgi:hypothetical protein